jgi:hypothetical protein
LEVRVNVLDDSSLTYLELDSKWAPEKPLDREAIVALVAEVVAWREELGSLEGARDRIFGLEFDAGELDDARYEVECKDDEIADLQATVATLEAKLVAVIKAAS